MYSKVTRKIVDETSVINTLEKEGYDPFEAPKLLGITALAKKISKVRFDTFVSPYRIYIEIKALINNFHRNFRHLKDVVLLFL